MMVAIWRWIVAWFAGAAKKQASTQQPTPAKPATTTPTPVTSNPAASTTTTPNIASTTTIPNTASTTTTPDTASTTTTPNAATTAPLPATAAKAPVSISDQVIECASAVSRTLGSGLPEIIYENALAHELRKAGLSVTQQQAVPVSYDGMIVGDYTADLLVEHIVMVELKPVMVSDALYTAACRNYLKATGLALCLTFNFATPRLGIKRVVKVV